jgi:hypothetical protein
MNPQGAFLRLGLTEKDGWTMSKDATAVNDAAKKWLKDNAETYRVQKFVLDKGEK